MDTAEKFTKFESSMKDVVSYIVDQKYPDGLSRDQKKEFRRKCKCFTLREGVLYYVGFGNKGKTSARVISNRDEQLRIVSATHSGLGDSKQAKSLSGHLGRDKTQAKIKERFYWPTITKDVQDFVQTCDACQRTNKAFKKNRGELQPIPVEPKPFHRLGVDLVGPLPETKEGYKYFITAIDAYTKWVESEPLKTKSAEEVAKFLYQVICRHGCFDIQLNDQGREFVNKVSEELHRLTGVHQKMTTAYHPQCNGLTERQNQTTQNMLLKYLDNQDEWADILQSVLFAYRTSKHASTGFSPFFLLYNRHPKLPVELMVEEKEETTLDEKIEVMEKVRMSALGQQSHTETEHNPPSLSTEPADDVTIEDTHVKNEISYTTSQLELSSQVKETKQKAMANIKKAQEKQKHDYNKRCNPNKFEIGNEVLVEEVKNKSRCGGKLETRFTGPYKIVDIVRSGVYRLQREGKPVKKSVSGNRLKPYFRRENTDRQEEPADTVCSEEKLPKKIEIDTESLLKPRYWLTDLEINACQNLLKKQHPLCNGLQDTCLSTYNQFQVQPNEFVQIYNANQNHWVLLSTIGCGKDEINVFDSLYRSLHYDTMVTISHLLQTENGAITVHLPEVQKQTNGSSCGLYAIAFATTLLNGKNPSVSRYNQAEMRAHLKRCLLAGQMSDFPMTSDGVICLPERTFNLKLSCFCKKPDTRNMKSCKTCGIQCHLSCLWQDMKCDSCNQINCSIVFK